MGDENGNQIANTEIIPIEQAATPRTRFRKKRSQVWEHFTIEAESGGCTRACCKLCKQTFAYSSGSKIAGTSHLKRHIFLGSCPMIKGQDRKQLSLASGTENEDESPELPKPKRRYRYTGFANASFDHNRSAIHLAKLVIMHDYSLDMGRMPSFVTFIDSLQPRFRVDHVNLEQVVMSVYHKEKHNLMLALSQMPGRISLTISLWTTPQTLGFVSLAGQFIDADWKLHRRMLNFKLVSSPHSENALSEAISLSLADWNMKDKLFTITLDTNCSSHDIYSANLRDHLANKNNLMLKGQLFVVRCYAHVLNVIAKDVIASIHGIIYSIRESIKFIKISPAREAKFSEIAAQHGISDTRTMCLDVTTHWNTTFAMLLVALDYKQAFFDLEKCDDNYNEAPSEDDWKKVDAVCIYLRLLYDSATTILSAKDQTANLFFHEAWKIQLDLTNAISSPDPDVSSVAKDMHEKFDKYWKDCSLVLAIAVVMDPRFKMKLVEFSYSKIYGADSARYIKLVGDTIHELYQEYIAQPLPLTPAYFEQGEMSSVTPTENNPQTAVLPSTPGSVPTGDGLVDFDIYLSEMAVSQQTKSELEQYLEESLVPRIHEFDILNWWKLNNIKYPTLSKLARDVLAIPVSMVNTTADIFDTEMGSRMLDNYRSSLDADLTEALFCAKDWLQYAPPENSDAVVKTEA